MSKSRCEEKLSFETKELAEGAATYAEYLHNTKLRVYTCKQCQQWHLTSD